MKASIITFPSYTRAHLAMDALASCGIEARLIRLSADERARGCAYGLSTLREPWREEELLRAAAILRERGIGYRSILQPNGTPIVGTPTDGTPTDGRGGRL